MKRNIISKFASRKFWVSVAAFITSVIIAFNAAPETAEKIAGIITAFGSVVVYVLSEAVVDSTNKQDKEE